MSGRKDLSTMLGGSVAKAALPGSAAAASVAVPEPVPPRSAENSAAAALPGGARWKTFERKETRLRSDQLEWLERTRKALNERRGTGVGERLTDNTLIRLAIDALREREGDLAGFTEEELARNLGTL
jgi:hypothetical protein